MYKKYMYYQVESAANFSFKLQTGYEIRNPGYRSNVCETFPLINFNSEMQIRKKRLSLKCASFSIFVLLYIPLESILLVRMSKTAQIFSPFTLCKK
jgi:hypothetical protein